MPTATPVDPTTAPGPRSAVHTTEHSVVVAASPEAVYRLVADVSAWPQVFGPTVHVEVLEEVDPDVGGEQLLRIWALANDRVRTWTSRRVLDPAARSVSFRQVVPAAPVASMGGEWRAEAQPDGRTRVRLLHDYRAVDDNPDAERLIAQAVDRNSEAELASLRSALESEVPLEEVRLTFCDSEVVSGEAADVYAFLERADLWPDRLPHVARLDLTETEPGLQHMEMDTRGPDGDTHRTTSVRVCFPDRGVIVYKQLRMPAAMSGHTGRWEVEALEDGTVRATSWHTVTLDPRGVAAVLGEGASLAEARKLVREALGTNSGTTLRHAKSFAEGARARS
ncbi:SRPBCC family protein [Streptomyces durbertensis]|uniref:SRPBCC family protein n=1 Tax=Streptomyces durbertensis TaxID=2448886 RepID=A0ABR6EA34_9ACTN|nr:SRPBCC family protein [Streptomyces durbertensis]MBB1242202.1 SRPBCC family protein [Streptomyces durbertensis]